MVRAARIAIPLVLALLPGCDAAPSPSTSATPLAISDPSPSALPHALRTCENNEVLPAYRVSYPDDWFVHPTDPEADVPACTYFGPEPFEYFRASEPENTPWSVVVLVVSGCLVSEQDPFSERSEIVDGFRATISEYSHGVNVHRYNWIVELVKAPECELDRTGFIQTAQWQPGDYETNKEVLDAMARSWDFLRDDR